MDFSLYCKRIFLSFGCSLMMVVGLQAQTFHPQDATSKVAFSIDNQLLVSTTVQGTLSGLNGAITFSISDLPSSQMQVSVQVATIKTGIRMRDNHLKKEEYFHAGKFPLIVMASSAIKKGIKPNQYIFVGTLTMKGKTQNITFPFYALPKNNGYQFSGTFSIRRRDFGIGPDNSISNELTVNLSVFATP